MIGEKHLTLENHFINKQISRKKSLVKIEIISVFHYNLWDTLGFSCFFILGLRFFRLSWGCSRFFQIFGPALLDAGWRVLCNQLRQSVCPKVLILPAIRFF